MSLTVEEILQLPGLEEMALRAGKAQRQRSVRWPYVAENDGIADWVMGGELVFVTGINLARSEANLLRLVREGHACGIAGLVILTGDAFIQRIPASVVALAEQCGLPLIEQPYLLKMVIVTHLIGTALVQMAQGQRSRDDILGQLLNGDYPSLAIIGQRAAAQQLDLQGPRRLAVLRLGGLDALFTHQPTEDAERQLQHIRQALQDHLQAWSRALATPLPVTVQGDLFVLLLAADEDPRLGLARQYPALQHLSAPLTVFIGVSSLVQDCGQYRQALGEARQALDVAESLLPASGLCDYSELGVLRLLQAIPDKQVIDDFIRQTLGSLLEAGRKHPNTLLHTLDALLMENGNALKAAQRLNIHRNTLNQRLQRIEQQSGHSLDDPLFRMNASVALLVWRMTDAQLQEHT
ncbi:MAG: PucR family transcriptional regulator ligand-binding domain-containing protein [Pseudomonas sp.]|uniref:PucR family transcriptional regulator n=1 Tax=Pseudomonas abieticivorans TaxID=2931382 RepID=UPI0020C0CD7A|nr:PucR family transcriptional regulator [Pseudomonas sp. PIA16]MDE1167829.1 PucR family transcriptional regulator ligand-binding domain-containing protein [Pseudomonas sp.]